MNDKKTTINNEAIPPHQVSHIVDPSIQMILVIMTTLLVSAIMYLSFESYTMVDTYPPITTLTPHQLFEIGGPATPMEVGITIRHFSEFDIVKGKFTADLSIWFRFNPEHIPVAEVSKFVFEKAQIKSQSKPFIKIEEKNFVMHYDMVVEFSIPLNYSRFPIDDHRLAIIVDNYFISPSQAYFESSKAAIDVDKEIHIEGWNLMDTEVQVGYFKSVIKGNESQKSMYHPRAIFLFDFQQTGVRYLVSICLPLLLIFYLALFSFSAHTVNSSAGMAAGAIAALIGFRFVMDAASPATGYFMISDYFFLFFLLASIFILLFNLLGDLINEYQKRWVLVMLHLTIIGIFYYWLIWSA